MLCLSLVTAQSNCSCFYYTEVSLVGPFCSNWNNSDTKFCLLDGKLDASSCPGAVLWKNTSFYWTEDEQICGKSSNYTVENCNCLQYQEIDNVGPYCAKWNDGYPLYCFLEGGSKGRFCPEASHYKEYDFYWTKDKSVCERSSDYPLKHCKCAHYKEKEDTGPYCAKWIKQYPPYCYLAGRRLGRFCPGATQSKNNDFYWTEDAAVCNRSIPKVLEFSLSKRPPFSIMDIISITLYSLAILIGTVGNVLVIKFFATGDASNHPGSMFVIVLAVVDFISSIWVPLLQITRISYDAYHSSAWPLGETACRILRLYPLFQYATSWLLLTISLERLRAIYKPFAGKLRTKFVLLISAVILAGSTAFTIKHQLSTIFKNNLMTYIDGTVYNYSICSWDVSKNDYLIFTLLGIWLPMLLMAISHISMFSKLKKEAAIRQQYSTHDSQAQLAQISRTFTVVLLTFYICYLPYTIQNAVYALFAKGVIKNIDFSTFNIAAIMSNFLLFTNSAMNPIIYSKLHLRIFDSIRNLTCSCRKKMYPGSKS